MPEALATTKRKFYKALDALTTTTASGAQLSPNDSVLKQSSSATIAFDEARERARKRLRRSTSTSFHVDRGQEASVIALPRKLPAKTTIKDASKPAPHFSPWSQGTFLARLKTFSSVSLWHPKPDAINEVQWAKRGWVCIDLNTVACKGGCERRVVVDLDQLTKSSAPEDEDELNEEEEGAAALEEALAERYKDEIVNGHSRSCMWFKAGCKDDIYRLPLVRPSIWQPELRARFRSLLSIGSSIEHVRTRPLDKALSRKLLDELPADVIIVKDAQSSDVEEAFEMAMHGWRGSSESGNDILHCDACFQRVGLWMYQPGYRSSRRLGKDVIEEEEDDDATVIDLVEMHREHCPWRSSISQKATGSLSGLNACQILHRVVSTCARDNQRRSHALTDHDSHQDLESAPKTPETPRSVSREEIVRQDKERESRMSKLKSLFNLKRKPTIKAPAKAAI